MSTCFHGPFNDILDNSWREKLHRLELKHHELRLLCMQTSPVCPDVKKSNRSLPTLHQDEGCTNPSLDTRHDRVSIGKRHALLPVRTKLLLQLPKRQSHHLGPHKRTGHYTFSTLTTSPLSSLPLPSPSMAFAYCISSSTVAP